MPKKIETTEPRVELSSDLLIQMNDDKKAFNEGVFNYKLPEILADKAYPLKFKEKKELEEKFDLANLSTNGKMDEFISQMLTRRGISVDEADELSYADLLMFGNRIYLGTFDAQSIAVKK